MKKKTLQQLQHMTEAEREQVAREEFAYLEKKGWKKMTLSEKTVYAALRASFAHQEGLDNL